MGEVRIVADVWEWRSQVPARLRELGAEVPRVALPAADYDVGGGVLVERKAVADLHRSVVSGRYWRQIALLRRRTAWPVLLVEGPRLGAGVLAADAVRGLLLATVELGVVVLRSESAVDSAGWLLRLAHRVQAPRRRARPPSARIPAQPPLTIPEAMLAAVPGISRVTARALLCRYGTIAAIVAADPLEWTEVPGFGDRRRESLDRALHHPPPS